MKKTAILLLVLLVWLAACTPTAGSIPTPTPAVPSGSPTPASPDLAVAAARQFLADSLAVPFDEISVISTAAREWPSSCLGIEEPGVACLDVITPGYQIMLEAAGQRYVIHTDQTGANVRQAPGAVGEQDEPLEPPVGAPLAAWSKTIEGTCYTIEFYPDQTLYGFCDGQMLGTLSDDAQPGSRLETWLRQYVGFEAETPAGDLRFYGLGETPPGAAERRAIAEWMSLRFDELASGRGGAAVGLALVWQRTGGIAGFCDDVYIYRSGKAQVNSCSQSGEPAGEIWLAPAQLEMLYTWLDTYRAFDIEQTDPAVADAMTLRWNLYGDGATQPDDAVLAEINALVQELLNPPGG